MTNTNATAIAVYPPEFLGLIRTTNLDKAKVDAILAEFRTAISIDEVETAARSIIVSDASQTDIVKQAHELRMSLRAERIRIDKTRKELKEGAKREVDLIDGIGRILREKIEPLEAHLQEQEDFAENQERERLEALKAERLAKLGPLGVDMSAFDFMNMSDEQFDHLLQVYTDAYNAKVKEAERQEAERIELEKHRVAEAERLRAENERLRQENEIKEREAAEQRRLAEFERQERERVENEARRKEQEAAAERQRIENERIAAEKAEAERIAADEARVAADAKAKELAPDRDKLAAYAREIRSFVRPPLVTSAEAVEVLDVFNKAMSFALDCFERDVKALATDAADCPF